MKRVRERRKRGSGTFYRDGTGYRVRGRIGAQPIKFRVATLAEAALAVECPERRLQPGDVVTVWVEQIGELTTTIA